MADDIELKRSMLEDDINKVNGRIDILAEKFNDIRVSSTMSLKEWNATKTPRNKMLAEANELYAVKDYLEDELAQLDQPKLDDFDADDEEMEDDED